MLVGWGKGKKKGRRQDWKEGRVGWAGSWEG